MEPLLSQKEEYFLFHNQDSLGTQTIPRSCGADSHPFSRFLGGTSGAGENTIEEESEPARRQFRIIKGTQRCPAFPSYCISRDVKNPWWGRTTKEGLIGRTFQICPSRSLEMLLEQFPPANCVRFSSESLLESSLAFCQALSGSSLSSPQCLHGSLSQVWLSSDGLLLVGNPVITKVFQPQTPLTFPDSFVSFLSWCGTINWLPRTLSPLPWTQNPDTVHVWQSTWGQGTSLHLADGELWNMPVFTVGASQQAISAQMGKLTA